MYNIETLAKMTGLTRRTIRYYVQRGLLDQPEGGGRGSYYTDRHLSTIEKIKKWSEQGVPLIHMKAMLEGKEIPVHADVSTGIQVESRELCTIEDGVELLFRAGRLSFEDLLEIKNYIENLIRRKTHEP
jgi:DNA-binding transcriptional MerR regulator